jgi:hypothetical protein
MITSLFHYYFRTSSHPTISTTAGIKHLQTKARSRAALDHLLQIVGYIISKPLSRTIITSITFLNLPMNILNTLAAFSSFD